MKRKIRLKKSLKKRVKHKVFRARNLLSLFSFVLIIVFIVFLSRMNLLPNKYIVLISTALFICNFIGVCLINVHKKIILKTLGTIIILGLILACSIGLYYLSSTNHFINESFTNKNLYTKNTYYVVSATNNNYKESDISKSVSVYKETIHLNKALKKLNNKYSVEAIEYDDIGLVFDNILNNTDKFMLVEKSSYEIVFSISDKYKRDDFSILYEFDLYTKKEKSSANKIDKFNVYVGGTDFAGLMDFNMIASVNTKTHKILLTSIPRDYYIEVAGKGGAKDKLSFMSAYGSDVNKNSLSTLFSTNIDYSVIVNTNSLVEIVDYVGGIEFCSDYDYTTTHAMVNNSYNDSGKKLHITKGCQHLNGIETLTAARERNAFPGRDRVRQENCQKIIIAIFKKLVSTDTMLHYNETLNTLSSLYETDLSKDIISNISKDILNNGNKWTIDTQSVDGNDGHDKVHLSNMIDWVMYPDQKTVDSAKNKIEETLK